MSEPKPAAAVAEPEQPKPVLGTCITEKGDGWEMRWCTCTMDSESSDVPPDPQRLLGCFCPWHGLASVGAVDHAITDPPYDTSSHTRQRTLSRGKTHVVDDLAFGPMDAETMLETARLLGASAQGWIIAFCAFEMLGAWRTALERYGAKWRRSGVWRKTTPMPQVTGDRPGVCGEALAIAWAGENRSGWNRGGRDAFWECGNVRTLTGRGRREMFHPTEKPVLLMERLVVEFTEPGDLICDPFAGSGTTGVAAVRTGRRFIGWERDREHFDTAVTRLRAAREQFSLFRPESHDPKPKQAPLLDQEWLKRAKSP